MKIERNNFQNRIFIRFCQKVLLRFPPHMSSPPSRSFGIPYLLPHFIAYPEIFAFYVLHISLYEERKVTILCRNEKSTNTLIDFEFVSEWRDLRIYKMAQNPSPPI